MGRMRTLKTTARLLFLALLLAVSALADDSQRIEALASKAYPHLKVTEVRQRSAWAVVEFEHKEPEPGDEHVMQMLWRKDSGAWFPIDLHRRGYELFPVDLAECAVPLTDAQVLMGRAPTKQEMREAREHGPFFADLSTRKLTDGLGDGTSKDPWSLMLMRNEIFARHGRTFQDPTLRSYFESRPWYRPDPKFRDDQLNAVERYNVQVLIKEEKAAISKLKPTH